MKEFIDPYSNEDSELKLLKSKPVSFLVVGKRRTGKSLCARHLSSEWGAKLISEVELIQNELSNEESEFGTSLKETLEDGGVIGKDIISSLYLKALRSEAAEHYGVVIDGIPDIQNNDLIQEIKNKVCVVVNLKILDNDLIHSRHEMGYDPLTGKNISFLNESLAPIEDSGEAEEDFDDEVEEEIDIVLETFDADKLVNTRGWVSIPEDMDPHIEESTQEYETKYVKKIEELLLSISQGYKGQLIELFCLMGYSSTEINQQMMTKINALDLPRAMVPILLRCDEEGPEELTTEEIADNWLRKIKEVNKPATRFRWKRSKWGRFCPVALAEGHLIPGLPNLSLSFIGQMFFFSSQERLDLFKINPRKYLLPTTPRNPIRLAVAGHPGAGKSTLVELLAKHYNCEVIKPNDLVADELVAAKQTSDKKRHKEATELAIAQIQTQVGDEERIDENDMRVKNKVFEIMKSTETKSISLGDEEKITLPPSVFVEKIKLKIEEIEEKRRSNGDSVPFGHWIIDGFPNTKDEWSAMAEEELIPYDLIVVKDQTEKFEHIIEKHYQDNKEDFDREFSQRRNDELKQTPNKDDKTGEENQDRPLFSSPEFDKFRASIGHSDAQLSSMVAQAQQFTDLNLFQLPYQYGKIEQIFEETIAVIDGRFRMQAAPWMGQDQQEEEDDAADEFGDEEEEEEESGKSNLPKRLWGASSNYDPVLLKQTGILVPGLPELQAKYKEFTYAFQNTDTNDLFLENPEFYINTTNGPLDSPPMRLCILGPQGCGKTTQAKRIAEDNNTFHVSFRDLVQEQLLQITQGPKVGKEFNELNRLLEEKELCEEINLKQSLDQIVYPVPEDEPEDKEEKNEENEKEEEANTERELAYKAYLTTNESIPHEFLDEFLAPFWRDEKYSKTGFILEGFPSCQDDIRYMVGNGLFLDACIIIYCEEKDVIKRNLPGRLNHYKEYNKLKESRLNAIRQRKLEVKEMYIEEQVQKELEANLTDSEEGHQLISVEEARLNQENSFSEDFLEVEDPHPESVEEAEERLRIELSEDYSVQQELVNNLLELLEEAQMPRIQIDGSRKIYQVQNKATKMIEQYLKPSRNSMFERVIPVSPDQSENLLKSNYLQFSSFGRWDPVSLKDGNVFRPLDENKETVYPMAYGPYIYFCYSQSNRNKFMKAPLEYTTKANQHITPAPPKPIHMAIVGPPKSGKSTLAKRFAAELGLMKISPTDIVELLLSKYSKALISQQIQAELIEGGSISNNLLYAGLDLILMDERCQTRGFVLDGMPSSQQEFDILQRRSIVPFRIIELEVSHEEVKFRNQAIIDEKRRLKTQLEMTRLLPKPEGEEEEEEIMEDDDEEEEDEGLPKLKLASYLIPLEDDYEATDHVEILEEYYQAYITNISPIRKTYSQLYRNWMAINARQNRWKIWTDLFNFMTEATFKMQRYMKSIRDDNIAQLDGICITPNEYEKRKGHFGDYCPVSFVLRDELVDCQNQEGMRFCVEYNRKYYRVSGSRELDFILAEPSKYLNDSVQLPKHLPRSITAEESHEWLKKNGEAEIKGFCAVSYKDGNFAYEALTRGSENIAVIHMRKCFLFVSEKHKKKFMLHPDRYINLSLPSKLPPKPVHIPFTSLPIGGYLEQGISKLFIEAIDAVGRKKPKFPFTSVTQSALLFVSIYLKASNPNMTEYTRMKWTEILGQFNNDCDNISFLGRKMTRRYRAPSQRLPELDTRLARFFNLKQKPEYMRKITS